MCVSECDWQEQSSTGSRTGSGCRDDAGLPSPPPSLCCSSSLLTCRLSPKLLTTLDEMASSTPNKRVGNTILASRGDGDAGRRTLTARRPMRCAAARRSDGVRRGGLRRDQSPGVRVKWSGVTACAVLRCCWLAAAVSDRTDSEKETVAAPLSAALPPPFPLPAAATVPCPHPTAATIARRSQRPPQHPRTNTDHRRRPLMQRRSTRVDFVSRRVSTKLSQINTKKSIDK